MNDRAAVMDPWEGDRQFAAVRSAVTQETINAIINGPKLDWSRMSQVGYNPTPHEAMVHAVMTPCGMCRRWTKDRLVVAFESEKKTPAGLFRTTTFVFCAECMKRPGADIRAWVRTTVATMERQSS